MKTYKNLSSEIKALNAETNAITAKINQEETEKEFNINELIKKSEKISTEYHKIHASNLPIFKKYNAINSTWLYKMHILQGRLTLHKLEISHDSVELCSLSPELLFNNGIENSTEKEWHEGVCKLLKIID